MVDREVQAQYARWMAQQPVGGVAVWAHTGRGMLLDDGQRGDVLECWHEAMGETPIVCGVGVPRGRELPAAARARTDRVIEWSVAVTRAAQRGGAAAVLVHPPTELRGLAGLDDRVVELHAALCGIGLPVIAFYLYEAAGGISYGKTTVERLLALDGVVGIKLATLDSVMTFQDVAAVVRQTPAMLITGEDRFLGYSFMMGADAALIGMAAACTDRCVALVDHWFAGEPRRFADAAGQIDEFARATFVQPMEGYVQRLLWALEADGAIDRSARDPFGPALPEAEREAVVRAVRTLRRS
jgi:4-hydroxy-tetrahydrodipicolinate synthase